MRARDWLRPPDDPHVAVERRLLDAALVPQACVLEAGCGRTTRLAAYRDRIARLVGVDVDEEAGRQNSVLDEFVAADLCRRLPFDDATFDLVYANFVLEHIADPAAAFAEWHRVLRPGGEVVLLAANARNPVMFLARLLPHGARSSIKHKGAGADERDVIVAHYSASTPARLTAFMGRAGFCLLELTCVGTLHRYAGQRRVLAALLAASETALPVSLRSTMVGRFRVAAPGA